MNRNYIRSRAREYKTFHEQEKEGYLVFRTAGSHGVADVIAMKPSICGHADCYKVKLIQIKVSENIRKEGMQVLPKFDPFPMNIEFHYYSVKTAKWREKTNEKKAIKR